MEDIALIVNEIAEGLKANKPGSGAHIYYEKKKAILDTLFQNIQTAAKPKEKECEYYNLSYELQDLKEKKTLTKELQERKAYLETTVEALRKEISLGPSKRLFNNLSLS
jgi:ATP-dependent DNA ligase